MLISSGVSKRSPLRPRRWRGWQPVVIRRGAIRVRRIRPIIRPIRRRIWCRRSMRLHLAAPAAEEVARVRAAQLGDAHARPPLEEARLEREHVAARGARRVGRGGRVVVERQRERAHGRAGRAAEFELAGRVRSSSPSVGFVAAAAAASGSVYPNEPAPSLFAPQLASPGEAREACGRCGARGSLGATFTTTGASLDASSPFISAPRVAGRTGGVSGPASSPTPGPVRGDVAEEALPRSSPVTAARVCCRSSDSSAMVRWRTDGVGVRGAGAASPAVADMPARALWRLVARSKSPS